MDDFKLHGKKTGPGGFNCPCCNPWNVHPRKSKAWNHRYARRKMKHELHKQVDELMHEED